MTKLCGIYQIRNLVNGKCYIGFSRHIYLRWASHRSKRKRLEATTVSRAIKKYGVGKFGFSILELCPEDELLDAEKFWIKYRAPDYNRSLGGAGRSAPHSESTRAILSAKGQAQWLKKTEAEKLAQIINNLTGPRNPYVASEETKAKLRAASTGKTHSVSSESRAAISRSAMGNRRGDKWIAQINQVGCDMAYWRSAVCAAIAIGIHPSNITKAISGSQASAGGFRWRFLEKANATTI